MKLKQTLLFKIIDMGVENDRLQEFYTGLHMDLKNTTFK